MLSRYTRWVIPLIIALVLIAIFVHWAWGNMPDLPIGYESSSEKARFLRYLSCSYAICAQPCNSPEVMALKLEIEDGITVLGCHEKCKELANQMGKSESDHLCGEDYMLMFEFSSPVTYRGDYHEYKKLGTDASRYNWEGKILEHNERCFKLKREKVTLNEHEYDRGCERALFPPMNVGLCEGVLMRSGSCDRDESGDCGLNTGHIWIGSDLESYCVPFNDNRYLANCTFDEENPGTVYIWTKEDTIDVLGIGKYYCPELIICSNSP